MPTKPPSIGMSTCRSAGEIMRAELTRATSSASGMSKSRISARRDGAAAGLDAPGAVEQQHRAARAGPGRSRPSRRTGRRRPRRRRRSAMRGHARHPALVRQATRSRRRGASRASRGVRADAARASTAATRNSTRLDGEDDARRRAPASRAASRARSTASRARRSRRGRRRPPAPRPTGPCARLRATRGPAPASAIIEPMAATAKAPLAKPSANTVGAQRPGRADRRRRARAPNKRQRRARCSRRSSTRAASRARRPPTRCRRSATSIMPSSTPPCCTPESCVDSPGVKPKTMPAKGSRIRSCAL